MEVVNWSLPMCSLFWLAIALHQINTPVLRDSVSNKLPPTIKSKRARDDRLKLRNVQSFVVTTVAVLPFSYSFWKMLHRQQGGRGQIWIDSSQTTQRGYSGQRLLVFKKVSPTDFFLVLLY